MKKKKDLDLAPSRRERKTLGQYILLFFLVLYTLFCALPIVLVFVAAFSDEKTIVQNGFSFIPKKWSLDGINAVLRYGKQLATSYGVTIFITVVGTLVGLLIMAMFAYSISRKDFMLGKFLSVYLLIPMLFSGGQLSCYIIYTSMYGLKDNVARKAGTMGKEENKEMEFWTQEEFQKFLECVADKPISYYAFEMLYWTGIREGELLALTPADFNFEKRALRINKSYQRLEGEDVITDPKTPKSNRTIVMPDFLAIEMEDFIKSIYGIKMDDRIFTISKSYLHHEMDRGAKLAGVKRIRIHGLRHSHISLLINLGFSALAIGERVGHEAVDITYHYAHLFPTVQTDMAAQLETEREALVNVRKE